MSLPRFSVLLSWLAGLAGLGLFVWLFTSTDVLDALAALPPVMWSSIPLYAVPLAVAVPGFARSIPTSSGSDVPRLRTLFTIRMAGESINNGLAPVKGLLMVPYGVRPRAALASALIGKTTNVAGEVVFLVAGVLVAAPLFGGDAPVVSMLMTVAVVGAAIITLGVVVQQKRLMGRGLRLVQAIRLGPRKLWDRALPAADAIDEEIKDYYRTQRRDFVVAVLWGAGNWLVGAFELWMFLALATDVSDPLVLSVALEAGVAVVKGLSFFVPASIGAQEGGIVWLFEATGVGREAGITYAVFRRFREMVWIGLGFLALWWHLRRRRAVLADPQPTASR
jgi:Lysylphosphatidylglycerol synthase TM region